MKKARKAFASRFILGIGVAMAVAVLWLVPGGAGQSNSLDGLSAREAVNRVNSWVSQGQQGFESYITTEALHVRWKDGREARVPSPAGETYVAIAPYVSRTHPCTFHYLSSCRAELARTPFDVTVRSKDGRVVYEGTVTSLANGFFELWLPRGLDLKVQVRSGGLQGTGDISTRDGAPTCITNIRLAKAAS